MTARPLPRGACDCAACKARDERDWDRIVAANPSLDARLAQVAEARTPEEIVHRAARGRNRTHWDGPA